MRFANILIISVIFLIFITVASAINCYDCNSLEDPRCNQYFSPEGVQQTDCDDADMPHYLIKYERRIPATGCITKIYEGVGGFRYFVRRSCYYGDLDKTDEACEAEDQVVPFADLLDCTVCDGDLCNTNAAKAMNFNLVITLFGMLSCLGIYRFLVK